MDVNNDNKPPLRVLALDPGHTTGWAVFDEVYTKQPLSDDPTGKITKGITRVACGGVRDWHGLLDLFETYQPDVMVYEIFKLYGHKAQNKAWDSFLEVEVIGVARYLAEIQYCIPIVGQTPNDGKHFFNDAMLKKTGFWDPLIHARDATSHGLYFLKFNKKKLEGNK